MKKYHYTYLLIGDDDRLYIGARSSKKPPAKDKYFGSFRDKSFNPIAKEIIAEFATRKAAVNHEIELHAKFDVARNPRFANRARQISSGFCRSGVKLSDEHKNKLSKANKGRMSPNKGKSFSEETKQKMSEAHKGRISPNKGKKFNDEYKQNLRKVKRKNITEEQFEQCKAIMQEKHGKSLTTYRSYVDFPSTAIFLALLHNSDFSFENFKEGL